ncbi:unnamed protein product [Sphacelaria rigidula]
MKRGLLYTCCRDNGYNKLVLAQHLDDLAESFIMSALHNGQVRTMKANYKIEAGDVRVIRPLCYAREALTKDFARANRLPIVNENCPACFEEPKERHRVKKMLAKEESLFPTMYANLRRALVPLMDDNVYEAMKQTTAQVVSRQTARRGQSTRTKKNQEGSNAEGEAGVSSPLKKSVETASSEYTVTAPTGNVVGNSCSTEPARQRTTGKESSPDRTQRQSENERRLLSDFSEQALERELARRRQLRDPTAAGGVGGGILDVDVNDDNADRFSVVEKGSACGEEKGAVCVPCFEIA